MYSVVLMAALTAGTNTPSWGLGCGGCHGCHGGLFSGCHGCHGGLFSGGHGCHGGYGCYGSACHGGYGGYGCYGDGCSAYAGHGNAGCYGGGCSGCHGMPTHMAPPPGATAPEPVPPPKKSASLDQARLIVQVPPDAKLYVDDRLMQTTSERRVFNSPPLEEGQTYYYILRAEVVRDGRPQSDTKRILIHAGEVIQASFLDLGTVATASIDTSAGR